MKRMQRFDRLSAVVSLAGALLFGWQCVGHQAVTVWAGLGVIVFLLGLAIGFAAVRCPFCGHYWGLLVSPRRPFCPWCGGDVRKD